MTLKALFTEKPILWNPGWDNLSQDLQTPTLEILTQGLSWNFRHGNWAIFGGTRNPRKAQPQQLTSVESGVMRWRSPAPGRASLKPRLSCWQPALHVPGSWSRAAFSFSDISCAIKCVLGFLGCNSCRAEHLDSIRTTERLFTTPRFTPSYTWWEWRQNFICRIRCCIPPVWLWQGLNDYLPNEWI